MYNIQLLTFSSLAGVRFQVLKLVIAYYARSRDTRSPKAVDNPYLIPLGWLLRLVFERQLTAMATTRHS